MVPEILDVLKDQAKAIKEAENGLQNKTWRDPISWLSLVQEGANLLNRSGLANVTKCFLCATLSRPPLIAVPLPGPFPSNGTASTPPPAPIAGALLYRDPRSPSATLILAKCVTPLTPPYRIPSGPLQEASFGVTAHFQKFYPTGPDFPALLTCLYGSPAYHVWKRKILPTHRPYLKNPAFTST
jgi:hypothetical protein